MALLLFILGVLLLIYYISSSKLNIIYLNNEELTKILKKDEDKFYKNLSKPNLEFRNIKNIN